jgi:hypothetical protein
MQLLIDRQGQAFCVYDEMIDLTALGQVSIRRGSHVNPDNDSKWWADLSPVQGPMLGPFHRRTEALAAEREWLETHWLPAQGKLPS